MIPLLKSNIEDQELIGLISDGDRDAFRTFYARHGGRLLGYLRRLGARGAEADDILQEVFLAVWRRANTFDTARGEVGGWLFTIARNKWFDWLRSTGRRPTQPLLVDFPLVEPSTSPETDLSIAQAMRSLKREQREALELAYFGGLTYQETATHLSLPLGTLKSRVRVGLQSLRDILETR
ncbi:MAG: RNA polymerase sigma factor [Thermoanaerobaculia bacterium]|nr:RNA polymerase sigma factor [Thermoanaerobaculia bacterium]